MSGFSNSVVGGQGSLIRSSIHSPDFQTGIQGWTINKDGSAEFDNLTIRGSFKGVDFEINSFGAFFYSGTPAKGNLILSITPQAGTDAHGNHYSQNFNTGVWSASTGNQAQHFGIDINGNLYMADSNGTTRMFISPASQILNFYNTAGTGLEISLAGTAGTDPFTGQNYPEGLSIYGTSGQYINIQINGTLLTLNLGTGRSQEASPANLQAQVDNVGAANEVLALFLSGPQTSGFADACYVFLQSSPKDGSSSAGGNLVYFDTSHNSHVCLGWGKGLTFTQDQAGQQYNSVGKASATLLAQTVVGTGAGFLLDDTGTPIAFTVANGGKYHLYASFTVTMGAVAQAINVGIAGPAATHIDFCILFFTPFPTVTSTVVENITTQNTTLNSAAIAAGGKCKVILEGTLQFTAGGVAAFGPTVGEHVAGDQFSISAGGYVAMDRIS